MFLSPVSTKLGNAMVLAFKESNIKSYQFLLAVVARVLLSRTLVRSEEDFQSSWKMQTSRNVLTKAHCIFVSLIQNII